MPSLRTPRVADRRPCPAGHVRLGAHMSIAGGVDQAPLRGRQVGCDTIQVFTKSNRQWHAKRLSDREVEAFRANLLATGIGPVVAHDCYLVNLAAPRRALWKKSMAAFRVELERAERLGIPYLVTHPGSHAGAGEADGIRRVAEALNLLHAALPRHGGVQILLETTAGQGTSLGYRFEQLAAILEEVEQADRVGVCLDTCHVFAAGYDIRSAEGYRKTLAEFTACLGLTRLKAIHLNDSKAGLGSRVDRHEHIGVGRLGLEAFRRTLNDPRLRRVPMILETPKDENFITADRRNLARLRRLLNGRGQRGSAT
ncbi:MAG: deoxyribonuclease IV [candidate division NC10 bacterium]|nr:deoxyribonuclease IV [candidate division NC10 bacterium]